MIENLRVASPVHRSVELSLHFVLAEMLVENVMKEFVGDGMIGFSPENAVDALQNGHVFECGIAKKNLSVENVGFGKSYSFGCNVDVALFQRGKTQNGRGFDDWQKIIHIHG